MIMKITASNISHLDLNLLRVLRVVLEEGGATSAARRLHVTQSAISNSLARLRAHFEDPLVVRNGKGLSPTPLAKSLLPLLAESLDLVEKSVLSHLGFNPKSSARRFTLACTDAHHFRDVPLIAARFAQKLPKAELRIVSPDFLESSDGLASGEIDAALCPAPAVPAGQPFQELYPEGFAFVVRRDHPRVRMS
jgi:DNA-binding transcriptional LysR family regulator